MFSRCGVRNSHGNIRYRRKRITLMARPLDLVGIVGDASGSGGLGVNFHRLS